MAEETGKLKGFCFVSYEDAESAEKAVKDLDGELFLFTVCNHLNFYVNNTGGLLYLKNI